MQKYTTVWKTVQWIISIIFICVFYRLGLNFGEELFECYSDLSGVQFSLKYFYLILLIFAEYVISVIIHESGHLVFGLAAGMVFEEFNIFTLSLQHKDGKFTFKKTNQLKNVGGYCRLSFDKNKTYENKWLVLYLLGGIVFNFICGITCGIMSMFFTNLWVKYFLILMAYINIYLGINNAMPTLSPTGIEVDMLKVINACHDPEYLRKLDMIGMISEQQRNGISLSKLPVFEPHDFNSSADIVMALLYVDKLIEDERYDSARILVDRIKTQRAKYLSHQNEILLSLQLIECELNDTCDVEIIKSLWTKPVKQHTKLLSKLHHSYLYFMYAGIMLAENNEKEAMQYLDMFAKISNTLSKDELENYKKQFDFIDSKRASK